VLATFEPLIGRPPYLRIAAHAGTGSERAARLHTFDAGEATELLPFDEADPAQLAPPALRPALAAWLAEQQGTVPVPALRAAWARPGWLAEAERWAGSALEPVRSWPLSAVLRAGRVYMKAVFPLFRAEAAITQALAREHPGAVPDVLRIDERGWMLMREIGGHSLDDLPATAWAPVLRTLAEIHRAWSTRIDELLAYGAQDRRREGSVLPQTLAHGDLNPGNAFLNGDRAVIFDWSDACVADPFVDVHLFLFWVADEGARPTLLDAYAAGWAGELSADDIRSAFAASEANAYLHQAESYRAICDALAPDDRWWFEGEEARWRERATAVLAGTRPSRDS
jgi:hypothetical protein